MKRLKGELNIEAWERRLSRWQAEAKRAAAVLAFRVFPHPTGSLYELRAAALKVGPLPRFFSADVREVDPTLNDDLLELYGRAGQALQNRFAFFGSPQAFEQGIDWEPPQSPSWRAELHAGDYLLDLACTFRISGEGVYARQLRYLIADWIAANPPLLGIGWEPHVLARRLRNWFLASDLARDDGERDQDFLAVVTRSLALQTIILLDRLEGLPSPSARIAGSRALLCASRFFQGERAIDVRGRGLTLLATDKDGLAAEPWPAARLERAAALMEWNLFSRPSEDTGFLESELEAALAAVEAVLAPDGSMPLIGPAARLAQDELADLAALAAVRLRRPAWKSLAGKFGILPYLLLGEPGNEQFQYLQETPWTVQDTVDPAEGILRLSGPGESALIISSTLPSAREDHQDFSSYELGVNGHRVVVDSGGFAPDESGYFPRARAHNLLLVDGQEPRWPGSDDAIADFQECTGDDTRLQISDSGFEFLGLRHDRAWFRLEGGAWLILDWLRGPGVHDCTSVIHLYPTFQIGVGQGTALAHSRASNIPLVPVGRDLPLLSVFHGDHPQFPGWYSPEFGVKFATAVLVLHWSKVALPWVGGLLIASRPGERFHLNHVDADTGRVGLEWSGRAFDLQMK
jgi:hypothetical protein